MKTFEELYNMYKNGNEALYDELDYADFEELYHECDKTIAKYYEFKYWLENSEQYYERKEV